MGLNLFIIIVIMEQLNEILANNLVRLRKHNNMTQYELASKLQYSDKTVSKWETGEIIPSVENLMKICEIYGVSLDEITKPIPDEKLNPVEKKKNGDKQNKIIISLLAILTVWLVATVMFVYGNIILNINAWMIFIWAVPVSAIVAIVFNSLWGNSTIGFVSITVLIWSLITAVYLHFLEYNIFAIYFIGIPLQVALLLWGGLKRRNKKR